VKIKISNLEWNVYETIRQWSVNHNFIVKVSVWITYNNINLSLARHK
jgi:hypothetical protein